MSENKNYNYEYDTSLTEEYIAAVNQPAEIVHDFRCYDEEDPSSEEDIHQEDASIAKEIFGPRDTPWGSEPMAFVVRNVLTPGECDELIDAAENFGLSGPEKYVARSAKRTKNYTNTGLSEKIEARIQHLLTARFRDPSSPETTTNPNEKENRASNESKEGGGNSNANAVKQYMGPFYGIHTNWRILRYDADSGDAFPAHQDQMDSLQKPRNDGSGRKDFVVSSHTLLLQLSGDGLLGGGTRFYPRGRMYLPRNEKHLQKEPSFRKKQFEGAVDVLLPRGWALVFRQRGLIHAGQPLSDSSPCPKYVAQAGVLRVLPDGVLQKPSIFKNGPGVTNGVF